MEAEKIGIAIKCAIFYVKDQYGPRKEEMGQSN